MAQQQLSIKRFNGAISAIGEKVGPEHSAKFIKNLNPFEDPSYITNSKAPSKISSTTVDGLVHWIVDASPWNTNRYAYDAQGKIYQINSSDTVSLLQTTSGSAGEGFLVHDNYLYYPQATDIGRYGPLDNSPSFTDSFENWWLIGDLRTTGGGTGGTDYTPQTSINEGNTHRQTFIADHDPIESITIDVDVVGTGDWTVTLHDANDRSLGTSTIANGSMSTGDVTFTLSSIARVIPGEEYHFHVTSTVADGGVDTDANNDLEGAEYTIEYQELIDADFHMMAEMLGGWAIGNERYIGFFDNINGEYDPNAITLAPGFEVRNVYRSGEYLIAEAWRGQSFAQAEEARRYYWDGIETTFNFFEDLPMGAPNAVQSYRGEPVGIYGNRGGFYTGSQQFQKIVKETPKLARGKVLEVYPGAVAEYEERLVFGVAASTDDGSSLEQGIYEYGSQETALPNALNFPYEISTGTSQGTTLKISALGSFGQDLYIGWRDGSNYGIDKITAGDSAVNGGVWESRIFDDGDPDKDKLAVKLEITFESLTTNQTVTPKYKINRAASFTTGTAATSGDTSVDLYIHSRFKEIEYGFNLASSSNTFIVITGINLIYNDLEEEEESA